MGGEVCYRPGFERGPWYELLTIRNLISMKESKGKDASYERGLIKSWLKFPEYKRADQKNESDGRYNHLTAL